jgi:hypothetical protein
MGLLCLRINFDHGAVCAEARLLLLQCASHDDPDAACATPSGKAGCGIGAPCSGHLVEDNVLCEQFDVRSGDALSEPGGVHLGNETRWCVYQSLGLGRASLRQSSKYL